MSDAERLIRNDPAIHKIAKLLGDNRMTDLPPVQYLEQAKKEIGNLTYFEAAEIYARALHENAQLRAEIAALRPRETLEQVARRECEAFRYVWRGLAGSAFEEGFLRAAEMAKAGELPDE